jgi:predicted DNA-binding transcriptional regulator AlpA
MNYSKPRPVAATPDPVLGENDAAGFIGVSTRTLQKWRQVGGGPTYSKIGRLVRYRQSALEAFLARGERANTSESA